MPTVFAHKTVFGKEKAILNSQYVAFLLSFKLLYLLIGCMDFHVLKSEETSNGEHSRVHLLCQFIFRSVLNSG